ncbi:MAG: hypothetical protein P8Y03_01950 [Anaerolineales bacterium]
MTDENELLIQREVRSPGAAAFAGIAYSILVYIIMILTLFDSGLHHHDLDL